MDYEVAPSATLSWMPRKKLTQVEKKVAVGARVDPKLLDEFTEIIELDDRTVSYMIERLIREFVENRRGKSKVRDAARTR